VAGLLPIGLAFATAALVAASMRRPGLVSTLLVGYLAFVADLGLVTEALSPFRLVTYNGITVAEAVLCACASPRVSDQGVLAWPDTFESRLEALALIQTLNAEILGSRSATLSLEKWCRDHRLAEPPKIVAHVISDVDKAPTAEHWIWVRASGPPHRRIILFDYDPSRGGAVPMRLLEGFTGILQTDGYEAYCAVAEAKRLIHVGCYAHARRKFEDARKAQADPTREGQSKNALDLIGQLYRIERELKDSSPADRLAARRARSVLIVRELKAWLDSMAERVLPQSALGKAVFYMLGQFTKLTPFLEHPQVPLDTNRVENAIRPFCIGRKNWLFSQTTAGAAASARLYSLVESAKANGIEPHAYLSRLFAELPKATGAAHFEALLPWNIRLAAANSR